LGNVGQKIARENRAADDFQADFGGRFAIGYIPLG